MRITVTRRGGFAGVALRGSAETSEFGGADAALQAHVGLEATPSSHPDEFRYEVTSDEGHTLSLGEGEITPELRPLIDAAMANASIV